MARLAWSRSLCFSLSKQHAESYVGTYCSGRLPHKISIVPKYLSNTYLTGVHQTSPKGRSLCHAGAKVKRCSHEGCANGAVKGGVCVSHGAKVKRCSHDGCAKLARKGGVCTRHDAKSLATAPREVERPFQPPTGSNAKTAGAIASSGSGKIGSCNPRPNISLATTSRQPISLHPSEIDPNLLNEEEIGAWIYKCSDFARRNVTTAGANAGGSGKIGACDPNISHANGCQSPSILSSVSMPSDLSDDEDDIIGAWVYKNWAKFR